MSLLHQLTHRLPFYEQCKRFRDDLRARKWTQTDKAALILYDQFVQPGDLVFDIGANEGLRTRVLLALGARVVAVEPLKPLAATIRRRIGANPDLAIINAALGADAGEAEIRVGRQHVISTLSEEWVTRTIEAGRFPVGAWHDTARVQVMTLDSLIEEFGSPRFVKIDVEGYEFEVLRGLSRPVPALSFEYTPECTDAARQCLNRLEGWGKAEYNLSICDSYRFYLSSWVSAAEIWRQLNNMRDERFIWGDVYVRY